MLAVKNEDGSDAERYAYDKAGNMVKKKILCSGRAGAPRTPQSDDYITTTFTFDGANQLVSSTTDGVTTKYAYDAAGRLVKEGSKTYRYGYLDKVLSVTDGKDKYTYDYHVDGQLASANYGDGKSEDFLWDGLALVKRGGERFINEPHIGGGNPVVSSKGTSYFNDVLGTTLGAKTKGRKYSAAALSAFGEQINGVLNSNNSTLSTLNSQFFTGKPHVAGLGHAFLFRNYRATLGKWQTADPLGYPDGWNQLEYCRNACNQGCDFIGAKYIYASFTYSDTYTDIVAIAHGMPIDAPGINPSFWTTFLAWMAGVGTEVLVDYAIDIAFPLWERYKYYGNDQGMGDIHDATSDEAKAEMRDRGFDAWEFVGVSFFSASFDATNSGEAVIVSRMSPIWQVTMRKWQE